MKKYVWGILLGVIVVGGCLFFSRQDTAMSALPETLEVSTEQTKQDMPLEKWEGGWIIGIKGENNYTEKIKNSSVYGEVKEFLTFETDMVPGGEKAAFVVAGEQEGDCFFGSVWFVNQDVTMLEQYICIADTNMQYQDINQKRYVFLNYTKEDRNCGRVFLCQNGKIKEVLKHIPGRKTVRLDGTIACMYFAEDEKCIIKTDSDTGEMQYIWEGYTEKPYILYTYASGGIREAGAEIVSEEELLTRSYGESIVKKAEELYPNGIKQYIVRENGEVNVNIAVKEEGILFFYLTFQTENPTQEPKAGKGCYLLHMSGEKSQQVFLESFAGETGFLPEDGLVLPWYLDGESVCYKTERNISFEEEELWKEKGIVGDVFIPEEGLQKRLSGLIPDYSENWGEGNSYYSEEFYQEDNVIGSEEEREFYQSVKLLGKTDSFLLYMTNDDDTILLKTADQVYLWADLPELYQPHIQLFEDDFDRDGEVELIILGQNGWSASGVSVEYLYIADRDLSGIWKIYQLQQKWYQEELEKHYQVEYVDGLLNMAVDGELVGIPVDVYKNEYYSGCSIDASAEFRVQDRQIELSAELRGFGPVHYSLGGNGVRMRIAYLGAGRWEAKECWYYSSSLESYITYEVLLPMEEVKEIKEIQYDPMLVYKCVTEDDTWIPITATVVSNQDEEILMKMDIRYEKSEDDKEGEFVLVHLE